MRILSLVVPALLLVLLLMNCLHPSIVLHWIDQMNADGVLKFWPVKEEKTGFEYADQAWDMEERMERVR